MLNRTHVRYEGSHIPLLSRSRSDWLILALSTATARPAHLDSLRGEIGWADVTPSMRLSGSGRRQ